MRSVLFRIPFPWLENGIPIHGYGLLILIGFFLAVGVAAREARRRGLPDFIYDLGLVMLLAGLLGGRLTYFIRFHEQYAGKSILEFFKIWEGGLIFYGGAATGALAGWLYLRVKRLPVASCLDVAAMGIPLGMAFGRLGCFLHGCCYGRLCSADYPLGVVFPPGAPAQLKQLEEGLLSPAGAPALAVHPVQLYQAGHDFFMFGLLAYYLRRPGALRGSGMPLLFLLYGVGRFFLEAFRGDDSPVLLGLTFSQSISICLIAIFSIFMFIMLSKARRDSGTHPLLNADSGGRKTMVNDFHRLGKR